MKEALLVIDVQNEYFTGKLQVTHPPGSLVRILQAMDACRLARIPVVVISHRNPQPDAATFRPGTDGFELYPEVKKRPCDMHMEKGFPGSFTGTDLDSWLRNRGIGSLTISGYMTQMCCDTTARQAFHRGYAVKFLSDATGTLQVCNNAGTISAADLHRATLITQQMKFSHVMTTSEWVSSLPVRYEI